MWRFLNLLSLFFVILLHGTAGPAMGGNLEGPPEAKNAAQAWLGLLDKDEFATAWKKTAPHFQEKMKEKDFVGDLKRARADLGAFRSRQLVDVQALVDPPKSPPGRYVVLLYKTTFAKHLPVDERVSMVATDKGDWSVAGYHFVR